MSSLACSWVVRLPWAEGGKEWGIVTYEQAGNDPDSPGSLEQTRRYKSLSPTAILPLSHTDLQYLSLSPSALPRITAAIHSHIQPIEKYANMYTGTQKSLLAPNITGNLKHKVSPSSALFL